MRRDLILVSIALLIWGTGENMFIFFQPIYLRELGASTAQVGAILGAIGVVMTFSHLPAGFLADRIGRRPLLWIAWGCGTLAATIMALSNSLQMFVLGAVLYGATTFVISPLNSYTTAARGNWSVQRVFTLVSAIYSVGGLAGPLLGGWLDYRLGLRANMMVAAGLFMLSTLVILFIHSQPVQPRPVESSAAPLRDLLNQRFVAFLLVVAFITFSMYLPQPLSQNYLKYERGINTMQIGWLISMRSLGVIVLNLTLGAMNARSGLLLAQLGMMIFSLLLWRGSGLPVYALGYFFLGSYNTARAMISALGRSLVQTANMGLAYGALESIMALSIIFAPPLAGQLYEISPTLVYPISMGLIVLALIASAWETRRHPTFAPA